MAMCAGYHAYDDLLIGPSISDIQKMYAEAQLAVADYLLNIPPEHSQS